MKSQSEAATYWAAKIPPISNSILSLSQLGNFAGVLQLIVNYQKELIIRRRLNYVMKIIRQIYYIYIQGDDNIQFLIKNIYLRAQNYWLMKCSYKDRVYIYAHQPSLFFTLSKSL